MQVSYSHDTGSTQPGVPCPETYEPELDIEETMPEGINCHDDDESAQDKNYDIGLSTDSDKNDLSNQDYIVTSTAFREWSLMNILVSVVVMSAL